MINNYYLIKIIKNIKIKYFNPIYSKIQNNLKINYFFIINSNKIQKTFKKLQVDKKITFIFKMCNNIKQFHKK